MSRQGATQGEQGPWRLLGTRPPRCPFGAHRVSADLDESERRLTHSELAVAEVLVIEGHRVRALAERRGQGRTADLDVCGQSVEVKSWLSPTERGGRAPTSRSVFNKLVDARDQGATTVLWAKGSGLSALDAREGVDMFAASGRFGGIHSVRVIGDGFDLAWGHRGPVLETGGRPASDAGPRSPRRPDPTLDRPSPSPGMALGAG